MRCTIRAVAGRVKSWEGLERWRAGCRPRLSDVAAAVGVSTASVSLVLRGAPGPSAATRERVLAAAAALGYRADRTASLLARRRTHLIGVPVLLRDPFRAELAEEVQLAAEAAGYALALNAITPAHGERRVVETLLDLRCEALVLLSPELSADALQALGERSAVVVVGRHLAPGSFDVVRVADADGVGQAVDHLVALGHREIVHVDGGTGPMAVDRRTGFLTALARHGLPAAGAVLPGGYTEESGAAAARTLRRSPAAAGRQGCCRPRCWPPTTAARSACWTASCGPASGCRPRSR